MTDVIVLIDGDVIQKIKDKKNETRRLTATGVVVWALDKILKENQV